MIALNDCHAERISQRSLLRFLYTQVELYLNNKDDQKRSIFQKSSEKVLNWRRMFRFICISAPLPVEMPEFFHYLNQTISLAQWQTSLECGYLVSSWELSLSMCKYLGIKTTCGNYSVASKGKLKTILKGWKAMILGLSGLVSKAFSVKPSARLTFFFNQLETLLFIEEIIGWTGTSVFFFHSCICIQVLPQWQILRDAMNIM